MRNCLFLGFIRASQLGCPEKGNRRETNWLPVKKKLPSMFARLPSETLCMD
jgi:hypothetical protein